jgi:hypothetical protein
LTCVHCKDSYVLRDIHNLRPSERSFDPPRTSGQTRASPLNEDASYCKTSDRDVDNHDMSEDPVVRWSFIRNLLVALALHPQQSKSLKHTPALFSNVQEGGCRWSGLRLLWKCVPLNQQPMLFQFLCFDHVGCVFLVSSCISVLWHHYFDVMLPPDSL